MAKIPLDVTAAGGVPDGDHIATVQKIEYQAKTGDKWNKEGTLICEQDQWNGYPADVKRVHITLAVPGKGNIWQDLYMKESALGFVKQFLVACGATVDKSGFDFDECLNKQISISVATVEQSGFDAQQKITRMKKA